MQYLYRRRPDLLHTRRNYLLTTKCEHISYFRLSQIYHIISNFCIYHLYLLRLLVMFSTSHSLCVPQYLLSGYFVLSTELRPGYIKMYKTWFLWSRNSENNEEMHINKLEYSVFSTKIHGCSRLSNYPRRLINFAW